MKINNIPEYAKNREYIVCRYVDDELWFWGAYDDNEKADTVALEIDGLVVLTRSVSE